MDRVLNTEVNGRRIHDFPENNVGFPERNDVERPSLEMERIHVDFDTLDISRRSGHELTRELASPKRG